MRTRALRSLLLFFAVAGAAAAAEDQPLAQIQSIVIQIPLEAAAVEDLEIVRAATGAAEAGSVGLPLYSGDYVRTGEGIEIVIECAAGENGQLVEETVAPFGGFSVPQPCPAGGEVSATILSIARLETVEEVDASRLAVVRAATDLAESGSAGQPLFAGDLVQTGAGTYAVIRSLIGEEGRFAEQTVGPESVVGLPAPSSLRVLVGRLLSTTRGTFDLLVENLLLSFRTTEVEVKAGAETADLLVLEGEVEMRRKGAGPADPGAALTPPPADGAPLRVELVSGERRRLRSTVSVENRCLLTHRWLLQPPERFGWLKFRGGEEWFELAPGTRRVVRIEMKIDGTQLPPGLYEDAIGVSCVDCDEPGCDPDYEATPLLIEVTPPELIATHQVVSLRQGVREVPRSADASEVLAALQWTDGVTLAGQPSYPAEGEIPYFDSLEERSRRFRDARYEAIWKRTPGAWARLGDVYSDWGDSEKAAGSYRQSASIEPARADSPEHLTALAWTTRLAGRLDKAEELLLRAIELDPFSSRALNALGNLYLDRAAQAQATGDDPAASELLGKSIVYLQKAEETALVGGPASVRRPELVRAVAATNMARAHLIEGEIAASRGDTTTASLLWGKAQDRLLAARTADRDYPFAVLAQASVSQHRARLAVETGDGGLGDEDFAEAESLYREALERHPDLAPAHYGLGMLWEDRSQTARLVGDQGEAERFRSLAEEAYGQSIRARPSYAAPYQRLGSLAEERGDESLASRYRATLRKLAPAEPLVQRPDSRQPYAWEPKLRGDSSEVRVPELRCRRVPSALEGLRELGLIGELLGKGSHIEASEPPAGARVPPGSTILLRLTTCVE